MSLGCRWQTISRLGKIEIFCRWDVAEMSLADRFPSGESRDIFVAGMSLDQEYETSNPGLNRRGITDRSGALFCHRKGLNGLKSTVKKSNTDGLFLRKSG